MNQVGRLHIPIEIGWAVSHQACEASIREFLRPLLLKVIRYGVNTLAIIARPGRTSVVELANAGLPVMGPWIDSLRLGRHSYAIFVVISTF